MRHNQKVAENIRKLSEKVEAAKSQDDLVNLIHQVDQHPGPLDYDDRNTYILLGVWALTLLYIAFTFFIADFGYLLGLPVIDHIFDFIIVYSALWMPAVINLYLAIYLDKWACKKFGIDRFLPKEELRFAVAFLAPIALFFFSPTWYSVYWTFMDFAGSAIPSYIRQEYVGFFLTSIVIVFFFWMFLRARGNWRYGMSKRIFLLDTLFNNNLKDISAICPSRYSDLASRFAEFDRGNDTRELTALYQGHYEGEIHRFDYQIYTFHYVIKRETTSTDSDGNTTTRTERTSHYRYGLLMPFPFSKGLILSNDGVVSGHGHEYKTASPDFNRQFRIRAEDELDAARLLSPAMIETLHDLKDKVFRPVLAVSYDHELCLAFGDSDIISLKRHYGLENPQAFAEEISGHANLEKLNALLDLIHEMMRLTDNNFGGETAHYFNPSKTVTNG